MRIGRTRADQIVEPQQSELCARSFSAIAVRSQHRRDDERRETCADKRDRTTDDATGPIAVARDDPRKSSGDGYQRDQAVLAG